jgi:hypothetical protein
VEDLGGGVYGIHGTEMNRSFSRRDFSCLFLILFSVGLSSVLAGG